MIAVPRIAASAAIFSELKYGDQAAASNVPKS